MFKNVVHTVYRWLSVFGLTQQEAYAVMLMALLAVIGSGITLLKPYFRSDSADSVLTEKIRTFKNFSERARSPGFAGSPKDFLPAMWSADSARAESWKARADSIRRLLAGHPIRETVDSVLNRIGDAPVKQVNINEAGIRELNALPGIGPKLAERIVEYRTRNGAFHSIEEIQKVKGIGKKMFAKIRPFIDIQ